MTDRLEHRQCPGAVHDKIVNVTNKPYVTRAAWLEPVDSCQKHFTPHQTYCAPYLVIRYAEQVT